MNIIPKEMIKENDEVYIYDVFNLPLFIASESSDGKPFFKMTIGRNKLKIEKDVCRNIWLLSKEMQEILWQTHFVLGSENSENYTHRWYGKNTSYTPKLQDLSITKIDELCQICEQHDSCYIRILWLEY